MEKKHYKKFSAEVIFYIFLINYSLKICFNQSYVTTKAIETEISTIHRLAETV